MAYTKVFAIRKRLDHSVQYAMNPDKTALAEVIQYAENPEKHTLISAINCSRLYAAKEMQETKLRWNKTGGVLGYHLIQSFSPGEVRAEEAHEIGVRLAEELFADRYEAVVATHLDQKHLHNHIVVNSVSFLDGSKYRSNIGSYFGKIRVLSDRLCREYHLSTITPNGRGKQYAEYQAEKQQKPTIRSMIRSDMDAVIRDAYSFQNFLSLLRERGYEIQDQPNRKYITVKPPGAKRAIRLASLGEGYSDADIKNRIAQHRFGIAEVPEIKRRYHSKYPLPKKRRKLKGFQALYFHYVYFLKGSKTKQHRNYLSYEIRKEVLRLDQYEQSLLYLMRHQIETEEELRTAIVLLEAETESLKAERNQLYPMRKQSESPEKRQIYSETIQEYTMRLKENRTAYRLLKNIELLAPLLLEKLQKTQTETEIRKEVGKDEYKRRDR